MSLLHSDTKTASKQAAAPRQEPREDEDAFIENLARAIVRRRLETPAVLFLEAQRPLSFISSQGLLFLAPFLRLLLPPGGIDRFARLLDTPQGVDRLIERIEEIARKR